MSEALVVVQAADILRTYTVLLTALALAFTVVNAVTMRPPVIRIVLFIFGIDVTLIALLFGQLANLGRSITWRTGALAVGVTIITVTSWLEVRARRAALSQQSAEGTEDGDQSS